MNEFIVLVTILFISLIGYTVIRGFGLLSRKDNLLVIAFSYGMGVGLVSIQLYLYSRLSIPWAREFILLPWIGLLSWMVIKNRKNFSFSVPRFQTLSLQNTLLLIGIVLATGYVIFEALLRPVTVWDGWAIWLLKSKIFFFDGRINPEMLNYVRSDYPLLLSLFGTFIYIILGHVNDTAVLLTSVAFYCFLGLAIFAVIKKKYGVSYALLFTFLFAATQNFIRHGGRLEAGQADLPLGYFTFICVVLLIDYLKKSNGKLLLLLSIFLGITCLIKFEGIPIAFVVVGFIFYHIFKNRLYNQLLYLLLFIVPLVDWQLYKKIHNLSFTYFSGHTVVFSLHKTVDAFVGTMKELANVKTWNMLWIIYFYIIVFFRSTFTKEQIILNCVILSQLFLYVLIYIFTEGNSPESSIERLLIHIAPLALYSIAISIPVLKNIGFLKSFMKH